MKMKMFVLKLALKWGSSYNCNTIKMEKLLQGIRNALIRVILLHILLLHNKNTLIQICLREKKCADTAIAA